MTVNTTVNKQSATGDGSTTAFDITDFKIQQATDVKVYVDDVLQSSGYTVVVNDPDDTDGGTVTFSSAPALDADILFVRVVPYTQLFDMQYEENISESDINNAFDKLVMMLQQVKEITDRCLKLNVISGVTELAGIDSLENLAGYIPVVNDDEDDFELLSPSTIANLVTAANGDVNGPATAVSGNVATFNGATGKIIQDGGIAIPSPTGKAFYPTRVNSAGDGIEYQNIAMTELTIASGSITPTGPAHFVDTESDAASDDLDTLATGSVPDGHRVILFAANTSRDVVIKHGTGNIYLVGDADKTLDDDEKAIMLIRNGSNWYEAGWNSGEAGITVNLSSEQTLTTAASRTVSHGLGTYPSLWGSFFVCKTAESNYAVNDRVSQFIEADGTYSQTSSTYATTSVVGTRMPSFGWSVKDKTTGAFFTGAAGGYLTAARWKQVLWWVA